MNFLKVILENSSVKEAKLYPAAKRAAENPALGITIQNQAAYHVIKDCANITQLYLPHYVFSSYQDPFNTLSKKFKHEDIVEFVNSCKTNSVLNQLLEIILYKIQQKFDGFFAQTKISSSLATNDDPYGDYALYVEDNNIASNSASVNNLDAIDLISKAFQLQ